MRIDLSDKLPRYHRNLKEYFKALADLISFKAIPLKDNLDDKIPREPGLFIGRN